MTALALPPRLRLLAPLRSGTSRTCIQVVLDAPLDARGTGRRPRFCLKTGNALVPAGLVPTDVPWPTRERRGIAGLVDGLCPFELVRVGLPVYLLGNALR